MTGGEGGTPARPAARRLPRFLPFLDLRGYRARMLPRDVLASSAVVFLDIPQGVAYAMIAGLPPAMGLYAAAFPAIVGALFRSSRHVVTGPSNALSLLVGGIVAAEASSRGADAVTVALTLAFLVGLFQVAAGLLRLDVVTDYVSTPVVRGYISGAAVLIVVGQLHHVTGTPPGGDDPIGTVRHWLATLPGTNPLPVSFALGTLVLVVVLRRIDRRIPGALLAMGISIVVAEAFALQDRGLRVVSDLSAIPAGLPPLTFPALGYAMDLAPPAVACAVLSLVESSSVARAIAARSAQRLDMAAEFVAQGLANLAASFSGAYPVSGSLARSTMNQQAGAVSRLSAVSCGVLMLLVLLFLGPVVGRTPIASLGGLLFVLAADLLERDRIRVILHGTIADRAAFLVTLLGTWTLELDKAIYVGVGISIVLFLRQARLLTMREMVLTENGRFREVTPNRAPKEGRACRAVRVMNVTGPLFFAVAGELEPALDALTRDPDLRVLILRLRQARALDVTTAGVLESAALRLAAEGRSLILLGLRPPTMSLLEATGIADRIGRERLFPVEDEWFSAMDLALERALEEAGEHACGESCPLRSYLRSRRADRARAAEDRPV